MLKINKIIQRFFIFSLTGLYFFMGTPISYEFGLHEPSEPSQEITVRFDPRLIGGAGDSGGPIVSVSFLKKGDGRTGGRAAVSLFSPTSSKSSNR
jgi:hypothetical protein